MAVFMHRDNHQKGNRKGPDGLPAGANIVKE